MEERLKSVEKELRTISEDVAVVKSKIFNGFAKTINEIHEEVLELRRMQSKIEDLKLRDTPDVRLATCPLKSELVKSLEKKFLIVTTVMTLIISLVTVAMAIWRR